MNRIHAELTPLAAINAIVCAGTTCLSFRPEFPKCCIPASVAGAEALRRHGVEARAETVVAAFGSKDGGIVSWCGATMQSAYKYYSKYCDDPLPLEEFSKMALCEMPHEAIHTVIVVSSPERSIIDLTSSQVPLGPETVHLICAGDELLPQYATDDRGIHIIYEKSDASLPEYPPGRFSGVVEDLLDAMDLAVDCRFNHDLFVKTLNRMML